jgi:hypothetical protein
MNGPKLRIELPGTLFAVVLASCTLAGRAGEISHYAPGVLNIRDFIVPEPGFYGVIYKYSYITDRLNDRKGNKVNSVTINPGPGPGATPGLSLNADV